MDGPDTRGRPLGSALPSLRDRGWTILTVAILALASLGAWRALLRMDRVQLQRLSEGVARSIANEIRWELEDQYRVSRRLAQFWLRFGRQKHEEWAYDTRLYAENGDLDAIHWVDPTFPEPVWTSNLGEPMIPLRESDVAWLESARDRVIRERVEVGAGPFPLPDGDHGYWVLLPIGKNRSGVLISSRRLQRVLTGIQDDQQGQCFLRVWAGDELVHESEIRACPDGPEVRVPVIVRAPEDLTWTVEIRPSAALIGSASALPHIVLAGGLLTAGLLGTVMWTRGMTRSRERQLLRLNLELESRVRARTSALHDAMEELQAFNYSVSHDLRSPLGAVVNFAGILFEDKGGMLDQEGRDHVERIQSSATAALTMLDSLLELSRAGRAEVSRRTLDTRGLVEEVWYEVCGTQEANHARLELGEIPACRADPTLLRLVLTNLVSNAVKFSGGQADPVVEVGGRREYGTTVLWVRDNGVGFHPDKADQLFKIFSRLHSPSAFPGNGIGLAIVDRIVRRHGGRVWAEPSPGHGATFFISLPHTDQASS